MKKRLLSILLAVLILFGLLPLTATAAEIVDSGTCGENVKWTLDSDGLLTISGTGPMTDYGYGASPFDNLFILNIVIEDGVTSIGDSAFYSCTRPGSVRIPDSITSIGDSAFYSCTGLIIVTIPDSVTSIGESAFELCTELASVTIPDSVTSIGDWAFCDCTGLTSVTIPDSVASIGDGAFYDCTGLTSVTIPDSVASIGDGAFCECIGLTSVTIPDSVTSIGHYAFAYCDGLTSVTIPDSVASIGDGAFEGCTGLTSVYFYGDAPELGYSAFQTYNDLTNAYENIPGLTLYYLEGKAGWTTPTWNGYPTATWTPLAEDIYDDIPETAWYVDAVNYAVANGLMNGVAEDTFRPEGTMTRAMLVTVLWRYAGEPIEGMNTFGDVPDGQWFTEAVAWAAENGIVTGVAEGRFNPDGSITREQMATILYRYATKYGIDTSGSAELDSFPDADSVNVWATDAMQWCVAEGIIGGSNGKLLPQGNATRAQVATILMRFIENVVNA